MGIATAHAADGTWGVDANGTWTTDTNWSSSTVADGATSSAFFGSTNGTDNTQELAGNRIVTLSAPQAIGSLFFGDITANAPAATWTVTGSTLTLGDGVAVGASTIGVTGFAGTTTINSNLAGTNSLVKTGAGALALGGSNTYSGGTTLSNGSLFVNSSAALGSGTVTLSAPGGGISLNNSSVNLANSIVINNAGVPSNGVILSNAVATVSGNIQINTGGSHFSSGNAGTSLTLSGTITANSGLTVGQRKGTVIYAGSGSSFDTLQLNPGASMTAKIGANNGLATNAIIDMGNNGTAVLTFDLAGFNQSLRGIKATGTSANSIVTNTGASASTLTLTGAAASTFGGVIRNGSGTVALVVNGGNQTLSGTNTYTGGTSITSGTLALSGSGAINSSALAVSSGAIFRNASSVGFSNSLTVTEGSLFTGTTANFTPTSLTISATLADGFSGIDFVSSLTKAGLLTVNLGSTEVGTYNLISSATDGAFASVTISGTALASSDGGASFTGNDGAFTYTFTNSANSLAISAVPEPATYAALAGLGMLAFAVYRRRTSVKAT